MSEQQCSSRAFPLSIVVHFTNYNNLIIQSHNQLLLMLKKRNL